MSRSGAKWSRAGNSPWRFGIANDSGTLSLHRCFDARVHPFPDTSGPSAFDPLRTLIPPEPKRGRYRPLLQTRLVTSQLSSRFSKVAGAGPLTPTPPPPPFPLFTP